MKELKVLFTYKSVDAYSQRPLEDECLNSIVNLDDGIKLFIADLSVCDKDEDSPAKQEFENFLKETEVILGHRMPKNLVKRAPKLKWFQAMSAGIDLLLNDEFRNSDVTLTNMSGISAIAVAETALALMLSLSKNLQRCVEQKQQKLWKQFHPQLLNAKTLGIIGLGSIGREVAHLASPFGMKIIAVEYSKLPTSKTKDVDLVLPPDRLPQLLTESDYVVICLPLTSETKNLIGEAQMKIMKPNAYLINISRGHIVDEDALGKALKEHWIAGAGLDVFSSEPLSQDSELWSFPNMIITPHIAGFLADYNQRTTEFFCNNLKRYIQKKKLLNTIDKKKGF
jgi:D-2-hydroxyacid dehydrogenase (NADP+)